MSDEPCDCCGGADERTADSVDERIAETEPSTDRWIADGAPLETELPRDVQRALGRFLGVGTVGTLGEFAGELRGLAGDGSITTEDLCLTDERTPHRGTAGDERYHFLCFYDAVILAALSDRPVDIRTESPDGTVIEALAAGTDELTVTSAEAAFSFGIDDAVASLSSDGPTPEEGYAAICPRVKAFPDRDAYERWARDVSAATVALPLSGATELAAELAR